MNELMTSKRYSPISLFDDIFNGWINDIPTREVRSSQIRDNIKENENEYAILLELPGYKTEEITIDLCDSWLSIKAEVQDQQEQYRFVKNFERKFKLPDNSNKSKITAKHKDGILKLIVPKKQPTNKKIEIKIE